MYKLQVLSNLSVGSVLTCCSWRQSHSCSGGCRGRQRARAEGGLAPHVLDLFLV